MTGRSRSGSAELLRSSRPMPAAPGGTSEFGRAPFAGLPTPSRAPAAPLDVAIGLIAHRAVGPERAAWARTTTAWLLGGPSARYTKARATAQRATVLCRLLPAPESLLAAADHLSGIGLADTAQVSAELQQRGFTRDLVPVQAVLRLIRLWNLPTEGLEVRHGAHHTALIGPSGRAWLGQLTGALRSSGGLAHLDDTPGGAHLSGEVAADLLGAHLVDGWLCPVTPSPPTVGLGYLVTRLLRISPQTLPDILAAATSRQVLDRRIRRPPVGILGAWLSTQPWCIVDAGTVRLAAGMQMPPHRYDDALAAALRGRHRPAAAAELYAAIRDAGYAPSGARSLLWKSPIPQRLGAGHRGQYRLRGGGADPKPAASRE